MTWYSAHTVTLPSGARVRARRPSLISLLSAGGFPSDLTAVVWRLYQGEGPAADLTKTPEGVQQLAQLIEHYVPHVLVSPRVGDTTAVTPGDDGVLTGTVALADLPDPDKQWLFLFGQRLILTEEERRAAPPLAAALESFRDEPARADTGPGSPAVPPAAVPSGGDSA